MMMKRIALALVLALGVGMCTPPMADAAKVSTQPASKSSAQQTKQTKQAQPKQAKQTKQAKQSQKDKSKTAKNSKNKAQTATNSNWRVKVAQKNLQQLGLLKEKPSGKLTDATTEALKSFQKQYKLKASGTLDDATYKKLNWEAFVKTGIANVHGKDVVAQAAKHKGVPYAFGGTTPKGFDCSGYVQYVFKKLGANLPRVADEQVLEGIFVTQSQLKPGDLVFFSTYEPGASHVGIYAGDYKFWNSTSSKGVMLSSLKEDYWKSRYYGARRVLVKNGEIK